MPFVTNDGGSVSNVPDSDVARLANKPGWHASTDAEIAEYYRLHMPAGSKPDETTPTDVTQPEALPAQGGGEADADYFARLTDDQLLILAKGAGVEASNPFDRVALVAALLAKAKEPKK